ncbi:DUF6090 family protein [Aquimarina sp. 2201CG5-10]|uniref:DUF6090 family protein n=1 Tax=Aquimarina callyspongiae TaxID=3098150 RepID=UPI002AB39E2C|nr:DUF6090 family protein [Aquimarina sp. 2201CG5-10]MDY8137516.1 DUF6090 family protein [Aquimarina sp. 2201CG5-10]
MIKFFRKIRQNLLSEGKTGKYLKYAIGEILLVVIGILIAVQVNNLNVKNQNQKKEILYLTRLTTNLGYDKRLYETLIKEDSILIDKLNKVEEDLSTFIKKIDNPIEDLNFLVAGYKFTSNKTTINNLVSSGQIEILRSNYLIEDIFLYYRTTEYIEKGIDESIFKHNRERFSDLIIEFDENDVLGYNYSNKLKKSIQFKITLIKKQIDWYNDQKSHAQKLIDNINSEINFIEGKNN